MYCWGRLRARTAAAAAPSRAGEPPGQAAERQHRAPADQGRHEQRRVDAVEPDPGGQHQRGPGHELRHDPRAARVVVGGGEAQAGMRAAERGHRVRDGQVAVVRDPVGDLEVGSGVAEVDDLFGAFGHLPGGERDRDGDGGGQRPPGGVSAVASEGGPGGGELAEGEVAQAGGQRDEHQHHRPGREPTGQQQREGRQQPGRGQHGGQDGDGAQKPPRPPRLLFVRRDGHGSIPCLSDPRRVWPVTHGSTIEPGAGGFGHVAGCVGRGRGPGWAGCSPGVCSHPYRCRTDGAWFPRALAANSMDGTFYCFFPVESAIHMVSRTGAGEAAAAIGAGGAAGATGAAGAGRRRSQPGIRTSGWRCSAVLRLAGGQQPQDHGGRVDEVAEPGRGGPARTWRTGRGRGGWWRQARPGAA